MADEEDDYMFHRRVLGKPMVANKKEEQMAFKFGKKTEQKKASKVVRLTSLFPLKDGTGYIGSVTGEYFDRNVKVVEEGVDRGTGVTYIVKEWKPGENPTLSVVVAEPYEGKGAKPRFGEGGGKARDEQEQEVEVEEDDIPF